MLRLIRVGDNSFASMFYLIQESVTFIVSLTTSVWYKERTNFQLELIIFNLNIFYCSKTVRSDTRFADTSNN